MNAAGYNDASVSPPSEGSILRVKTQLDSLAGILAGATDADFHRRPADGKWSAHEQLAHLGRYHEIFLERLSRILSENRPVLGRYRAEEDPGALAWFSLPTAEVLVRMRELRAELIRRVSALAPEEWRRIGVHPAFGELRLSLWLEFFLIHEGHHLYAIFRLVRERRA